ncbi:lipopolysaccharide assembly protein LapB [uncultured Bacteroides sp.]|uniref:tetratricopeptide repeat protein n=1 Tax=uncultured Bacteroides sp. TaxID=162156 RepID=UPI0025EC2491|nr:tetratricopeptide repeat protein [uncultured Bacteroides sp.]
MKTTIPVYAAFFLISVLSISCNGDSETLSTTFSKIENCIETYPDTALYLLNSICYPEKLHGKSQADYALLMTQAMDKNYMKFRSDSLIALALNYYTLVKRDPDMRAKTQFYYGRVLLESGKYEEALEHFLSANEYFKSISEYKMLALIAGEIGKINRRLKRYKDALISFQQSYNLHECLSDSLGITNASQSIARVYLFENKWDSSHYYYNHALEIAVKKQYPLEVLILHELGILYSSMGKLDRAEPYFLAALEKETDKEKKYIESLSLGYLYMQMGKVEDARRYLQMSIKSSKLYTRVDAYYYLYFLEKEIDNFEEAIVYHEKADSIINAIEEVDTYELVEKLQKQYENEKLLNEHLHIKVRHTKLIWWGTIAFLIVAFYMCYYYNKSRCHKKQIAEIKGQIRNNEEEIKRYQQEAEEIQKSKDQVVEENKMLEENRTKVGELNGKIILLTMQNKNLSGLLKELGGELSICESSEQYISGFRLLLAIKEGTLRGKLSGKERDKLFRLFDLLYDNYVSRLLKQNSSLTKHDLEISCFLKFGLNNEELSRIFQTTTDSVTKAKGRLKGRLGIPPQDDLGAYLRDF